MISVPTGKGQAMSRYIDADHLIWRATTYYNPNGKTEEEMYPNGWDCTCQTESDFVEYVNEEPSIDIVRCSECKKSHIDGKTTHYLWCTEWGRSTDTFGYCERGEREGE